MRRVLVDTNVIVSALIFPGSTPARALSMVMEREQLVLSDWILDELREVVERKWPDRLSALEMFITAIGFEGFVGNRQLTISNIVERMRLNSLQGRRRVLDRFAR